MGEGGEAQRLGSGEMVTQRCWALNAVMRRSSMQGTKTISRRCAEVHGRPRWLTVGCAGAKRAKRVAEEGTKAARAGASIAHLLQGGATMQ